MFLLINEPIPKCCRECPVREEHYSPLTDKIRCRVYGGSEWDSSWVEDPDTIPVWCPAQQANSCNSCSIAD